MENQVYVTTDSDMWNSADEARFFVIKGQVKPLPEFTTAIIEDALEQKLLRVATSQEVEKYFYEKGMDEALMKRKIEVGRDYKETLTNYQNYLDKQKKIEEKAKIIKEHSQVLPSKTEIAKPEVKPEYKLTGDVKHPEDIKKDISPDTAAWLKSVAAKQM